MEELLGEELKDQLGGTKLPSLFSSWMEEGLHSHNNLECVGMQNGIRNIDMNAFNFRGMNQACV